MKHRSGLASKFSCPGSCGSSITQNFKQIWLIVGGPIYQPTAIKGQLRDRKTLMPWCLDASTTIQTKMKCLYCRSADVRCIILICPGFTGHIVWMISALSRLPGMIWNVRPSDWLGGSLKFLFRPNFSSRYNNREYKNNKRQTFLLVLSHDSKQTR